MNAEEIMSMPAGRDMDQLIAAKVLGRRTEFRGEQWYFEGETSLWYTCPYYSSDLCCAWELVEWLRERWGTITLTAGLEWHCLPDERYKDPLWGCGDEVELAICRAALLTVAEE